MGHALQDNRYCSRTSCEKCTVQSCSTSSRGQPPEWLEARVTIQAKLALVTLRAPKNDPEVSGDYPRSALVMLTGNQPSRYLQRRRGGD
jgi:hypothetical protein